MAEQGKLEDNATASTRQRVGWIDTHSNGSLVTNEGLEGVDPTDLTRVGCCFPIPEEPEERRAIFQFTANTKAAASVKPTLRRVNRTLRKKRKRRLTSNTPSKRKLLVNTALQSAKKRACIPANTKPQDTAPVPVKKTKEEEASNADDDDEVDGAKLGSDDGEVETDGVKLGFSEGAKKEAEEEKAAKEEEEDTAAEEVSRNEYFFAVYFFCLIFSSSLCLVVSLTLIF